MADFRLEKWYLDCVTADGAVLIGYAARVRWGVVRLSYGALLTMARGGRLIQRQSPSCGTVNEGLGTVHWVNDRLRVRGEWTGGHPIPRTIMVDEPLGHIEWTCLGADCAVDVLLDGRVTKGTGYVDRLAMTIPPWNLPFTELRWGRFISDDRSRSVVWTDMRGGAARTWVWVDSAEPVGGTVDERGVRTGMAELAFLSSEPLRTDNVARTLLGRFHAAKQLLPAGLRAIQEDKRVGTSMLRTEGAEVRGSSIHEVVIWGRA